VTPLGVGALARSSHGGVHDDQGPLMAAEEVGRRAAVEVL
jgi:hypothetical protein